ncbi:hypothetical protein PUR71_08735 [Streptomyces sp. SP17BM10]|uniref:hypothetical protein n=1 Tax=Streptomyces sp. SP17BM10 TaxID=3002530 RepID=UPI002E78FD86|nr:hypothetical protein [Streptomyces sp. SP17BM10]MEE1783000.1 hypothetical protein [Streptomyces sp. SP17BM10]
MTDSVQNTVTGPVTGNVIQGKTVNVSLPVPERPAEDQLAALVRRQWEDEANVRGLTGAVPMPVRWDARQLGSLGGRASLDEVLTGICSLKPIRLIVTGPGGAGKSSLAVLLVLALLRKRKPGEPVPVLLSLSDWVPGQKESLDDWVIRRIREDYGELSARPGESRARQLVDEGRIVPVLDGLDELMPLPRTETLIAIDRWRASVDAPLVLLSRPEAFNAVSSTGSELRNLPVIRAHPMTPEAARDYLADKCADTQRPLWAELFKDPNGPVATALSSPLMVWLATKVYADGSRDPRELLDHAGQREDVERHLLDELLPALYTQGPAPASVPHPVRRYEVERARTHHRFLARQSVRGRTQDIAWWQLRAVLTDPLVWGGVVMVAVTLFGSAMSYGETALFSLVRHFAPETPFTTTVRTITSVALAAAVLTVTTRAGARQFFAGIEARPRRLAGPRRQAVMATLTVAPVLAELVAPTNRLATIVVLLPLAFSSVVLTRPVEYETATRPRALLKNERRIAITEAGFVGSAAAGAFAASSRPLLSLGMFLASFACSALACLAMSRWGRWAATRFELAVRGCLPWDAMTFLEDARRLGMLRRTGGIYQYRHAELRGRLAGAGPEQADPGTEPPAPVLVRSTGSQGRALRRGMAAMMAPNIALVLVVPPFVFGDGYRAALHTVWDRVITGGLLLPELAGVLLIGSLLFWAVGSELRVDAEGIALGKRRRVRLRWDEVTAVRVHPHEIPGRRPEYVLEAKPRNSRDVPQATRTCDGWVEVWYLDHESTLPLDLEAALTRFAGHRWPPKAPPAVTKAVRRGRR